MSWNRGTWGPGIGSVEAIDMVLPSGEKVTASKDKNQDLFWAARGAGSGFFAVATQYHLELYSLSKAITASVYFYPYERMIEVADWLGPLASELPSSVELSLWAVAAPPELADTCKASNGLVTLVTATMFAESADEAKAALSKLDTCPIIEKCLQKSVNESTNFEKLFDASGTLWPENLRAKVDAIYSNAPVSDMLKAVKDFLPTMPSKKTVFMFAKFTGMDVPAPLPDAAFSMSARLYGGPWTMWDKAEDDAANIKWHEELLAKMKPHIYGRYVSESNTTGHPEFVKDCYKPKKLARLNELRQKHDPDGLFFNYTDGLS